MRIELHIPTEQYGFVLIALDSEHGQDTSPENVAATYRLYSEAFKDRDGLSDKEMDEFVENMVLGKGNYADQYARADLRQQIEIQRLKRAIKRIKSNVAKQ